MADAFAFSSASRPRSQDVGVSVSAGISELLPVPCIKLGADIGLNLGKTPGQHDIAAGRSANIAEVRKNADARKEISTATGADATSIDASRDLRGNPVLGARVLTKGLARAKRARTRLANKNPRTRRHPFGSGSIQGRIDIGHLVDNGVPCFRLLHHDAAPGRLWVGRPRVR